MKLTSLIKEEAIRVGFDLVGIASASPSDAAYKKFKKWLKKGNNADMEWMAHEAKKRSNPREILQGAKSVICLALNYFQPRPPREKKGKIATYAIGRDYHKVLRSMLKSLDSFIKSHKPDAKTKYCADTGPLLERTFASRSGLGFIGKNSCLITREFGSYVFLAEIITDLDLKPDKPSYEGSCGTCARCMDACPNKAIGDNGIDARKCISYHTIENRGKIPRDIDLQGWIFGCDICQQVCPHNCRASLTKHQDFTRHIAGFNITRVPDSDAKFLERFAGSPLMRAKRRGLQRNLQFRN